MSFDSDIVFLGLGREHTFRLVTVSLSLAVLLVGVLHGDVLVHKELPIHVVDGIVASFKGAVAHEAIALAQAVVVAGDLGGYGEGTKATKGVV